MASRLVEKAYLSAKGLLGKVRKIFEKVKEPPKGGQRGVKEISIADCLMSALAIFKLKFASLLQFEQQFPVQFQITVDQQLKICQTFSFRRFRKENSGDDT